jgi:HPt (histidine-containing phosphotransfer) domain-containing protein
MTRTPEMSATVRRALDERWPRVYEAARAHFATIDAFTAAGGEANLAQRLAARSAAHKLSGSLGMFGRRDASSVAAAIEDLLTFDDGVSDAAGLSDDDAAVPAAAQAELRALVTKLDGLISLDPAG